MKRMIADFVKGITIEGGYISFVQQDTDTATLSIQLKENDVDVNLTGKKAVMAIETPSGAVIERDLTVVDIATGETTYTLPYNALIEEGKYKAQIQLYSLDPFTRLSTVLFTYIVSKSLVTDDKLLASSEFGTLQELIVTVTGLENEVAGNVETIEQAQLKAEQAKNDAIMSTSYAIQAQTAAKEAATSANEALGVLDNVIIQAQAAATASKESAEASKASADEAERASNTALSAATKAEQASNTANQAIINVNQAVADVTAAKEIADQAQSTATTAIAEVNNAIINVNQAVDKATQSVNTATTAINEANNALSLANQANNTAQSTLNNLDVAINAANTATQKATQATEAAQVVTQEANAANLAANKAVADATTQANTAKEQATIATQKASEATTQANKSQTEADRATVEADRAKIEADRAGTEAQTAIETKITLNGQPQENFNFIANEVVPDGLKLLTYDKLNGTNIGTSNEFFSTLKFNKDTLNTYEVFVRYSSTAPAQFETLRGIEIRCSGTNINLGWCDSRNTYFSKFVETTHNLKHVNEITLSFNGKVVTCNINGKIVSETIYIDATPDKLYVGSNIGIMYSITYNRILTPAEIQHNFQVLNNSPSLISMNDYAFATDSEHVTMKNGFNVEEAYTGLAKTMAREFTSTGDAITVNNGVDKSKILMASIEGNTVKNYANSYTNDNIVKTGTTVINSDNTATITSSSSFNNCFLKYDTKILSPNTKYKVIVFIKENTINGRLWLNQARGDRAFLENILITSSTGVGIKEYIFTTRETLEGVFFTLPSFLDSDSTEGKITFSAIILDENAQIQTSYIPFGLSSTEASISNNSNKYPFYEPTIKGETKVVDGKLVSLEPSMEGLPVLGEWDIIDRINMKMVIQNEMTLNGMENWALQTAGTKENTLLFYVNVGSKAPVDNKAINTVCNKIQDSTPDEVWNNDVEGICTGALNQIMFRIAKSKLATQDVNGLNQWLQTSPVTVRYQLATPIEQQLTPSQLHAYDSHKRIISLPFAEDKLTLNEDGSATWIDASEEMYLNVDSITTINTNNATVDVVVIPKPTNFIGFNDVPNERKVIFNKTSFAEDGLYETKNIGLLKPSYANANWGYMVAKGTTLEVARELLNGMHMKFVTKSSTTTHIPKSLCPTIPINKTNILSAGDAVKASSFTVSVPVDRIGELEERLSALETLNL